uniref:Uncharacterized protein n=2 Tax=Meloidogyne TaxID=189290 RepID=A0A6V7WLB4_MELEN|nr:unnamed protein product [Meloidogyne enterolobii]
MIREFWQNVDKVVDFRANEIVELKKRRALDQHLNFLVGAADKITSLIHENFATQSNGRSSTVLSKSSDDFEMDSESDDNESTLDVEEANGTKGSVEEELDELSKEQDMDMDQLLTSLPEGYLESLGYSVPTKDIQPDINESLNDEQTRTTADLEQEEEGANFNEKPDLRNVDYNKLNSENSEVRRQQLDNIAEAALEFQPRGYTLETTEVKTEVPFLLTGQLREYQLVGLDWLVTLYEKNLNGILADEMGLGKTIQTIALLAHLACARAVWGPHLIIVPTSVLLNWEMELKKWCPSLKVLNYFGSAKERAEKRKGWSKSNAFHICITSYKLVTQDIRAFKNKAWQYLILDEAQNIKNFRSQRWQLLIGLRSRRRLLLTGTPLQNSLMELWALLHFLMPNVFASHDDFREWFHCPITGMVEGNTEVDQALVQRLHKILRPFILRRLKSEVEKQLPTKTERVLLCHLSKRQRYLYNEFLSKTSTVENLKTGSMFSVLGVIMQLRKCCNHPNLFEPRPVVSPLFIQPISPQFSSRIFSINQKLDASELCYGNSFSSDFVWKTFKELLLNGNFGNNSVDEHQILPLIDGLKFVMDKNGGHFYRPKIIQEHGEDELICNGLEENSSNPIEFVNNTRKRKMSPQEATTSSELCLKIKANTESNRILPNFLKSPSFRLNTLIQKKENENKRIGVWLSTSLKQFSKPLISTELMNFCRIIPNNFQLEEPLTTKLPKIKRFNGQSIIDEINERIGQNLLEWIENSLNSFLICVQRLLVERCFEPPQRFTLQQENLRLLTHNIYSSQISLAHKAELAAKLEFPELRLIEYDCGKLQVLARLLEQLYENKHRCLIFTQMSKMLDILQAFLSHHNYNYFRLDGSTHIDQRQAMMERFNTDSSIFCFILSTRSGGIGVNLTGADTVIFYDSDWNPTMDAQAQDRCHRIGQTRNVTIYRLISERTIEENILTKSTQKRRLGEMTIDEGEFTPDFFKSANNLRELFNNEETVANILKENEELIKNNKTSTKELEMAMLSVEDTQDVLAAQKAKEENNVDLIEFDENTLNNGRGGGGGEERGNSCGYIESPSEQYLELINELKPIERYAVNFLTNEYRPALDKEFEETEALIRAKQKEFLQDSSEDDVSDKGSIISKKSSKNGKQQKHNNKTIEEQQQNITFDANLNELPFFATLDMPFEEIPAWMPPSPPNSILDLEEENWNFNSFEDSFFYEPYQMPEECLPQLPPLISINEIPPRISIRRQRKFLNLTTTTEDYLSSLPLSPKISPPPPSIPKHRKRTGSAASRGSSVTSGRRSRLDQHNKGLLSISTPPNTTTTPSTLLLSPPGTPSLISSSTTTIPIEKTTREEKLNIHQRPVQPSKSNVTIPGTVPSSSFSSLDESIESTVRKSRKQAGHGPISRYISRNNGQPPQKCEERLPSDPSRSVFRLVCPEWRTNPSLLNLPQGIEDHDYEGQPIWSANEDIRLLKALTSKHGMDTYTTPTTAQNVNSFQPNWDFVSQYVNVCSSHYRSPRQCALRYQNQVLHCDESSSFDRASSSRKRQQSTSLLTSVIVDNNFCNTDTTNLVRRRAGLITEITKQNRLKYLPEKQQQQQTHHHHYSSQQILCLTGRLPQHQEQRLLELGARYTNVVRPMDVLDVKFIKKQQHLTENNNTNNNNT